MKYTASLVRTLSAALLTLASLVAALFVGTTSHSFHRHLLGVGLALVFSISGCVTVRLLASKAFTTLAPRTGSASAGAVRLVLTVVGYFLLGLFTLDLLAIPVQHLLVGTALTGVIAGLAAQQALGNLFAGLVLLLTRPITVGQEVWVRSGALGGELSGTVLSMGATYVTLDTPTGVVLLPNSSVLAAAVGPTRTEDPAEPTSDPDPAGSLPEHTPDLPGSSI